MDNGLLNILSLLLGTTSLIVPIINIIKHKKVMYKDLIISMSCCLISLCLQILSINYLINISDISALMDIISFTSYTCLILLISNIILNYVSIKFTKRA